MQNRPSGYKNCDYRRGCRLKTPSCRSRIVIIDEALDSKRPSGDPNLDYRRGCRPKQLSLQAAVDFAGHKPHPDHFLSFLDRHAEIWDEFVKVHACRGNSESGLDGACFLSRWENKPHPDHFLNFLDRHEGERGISPVGGNLGISSTGTRERILKVLRARFGPNGLQTDVLDVDLKPFGTGLQNLENRARQPPKPHPAHL